MSRQSIPRAHTHAYARIRNASRRNATVNLVRGDAACVTLCRARRGLTRSTAIPIGLDAPLASAMCLAYYRHAWPILYLRGANLVALFPFLLTSPRRRLILPHISHPRPPHLLSLSHSLCRFPLDYAAEIMYGKIRVDRGGSDNE